MSNFIFDLEQVEKFIYSSTENWKLYHDANSYRDFIFFLEYMDHIVEQYFDKLEEYKNPLYLNLETLFQYVQRKDLIAVIDLLEYELKPLISQWKKGVRLNDHTKG